METFEEVELLLCNPPSISSLHAILAACDGHPITTGFWHVPVPMDPSNSPEMEHSITVIITTSPVPSNPSTELLERVLLSFQLIPGLSQAPKIIVCDGYKVANGRSNPKAGDLREALHIYCCYWRLFVMCFSPKNQNENKHNNKTQQHNIQPKSQSQVRSVPSKWNITWPIFKICSNFAWLQCQVLPFGVRRCSSCLIVMASVGQWRQLGSRWKRNGYLGSQILRQDCW